MSGRRDAVTRRRFLGAAALASAGVALGVGTFGGDPPEQVKAGTAAGKPLDSEARAKVVLVRDKSAVDAKGTLNAAVVAKMLDDAVCALSGEATPTLAWKRYFGPKDLVGIKSNVWKNLPTPPEVEETLRKRIASAGVPEGTIRTTDRSARTELADRTALLNVRPVRTHHWSGIGGCIKNYIMFVEEPSDYHGDSCADLGAVWNLPIVKGKTRLNILLALTPQFYGRGPHNFDPRHTWSYCGLFASKDPVACDALGAELLRLKRLDFFGEDKPVTPTKHVGYAETRHGIGVADLKRIDLVRVGWTEQALL